MDNAARNSLSVPYTYSRRNICTKHIIFSMKAQHLALMDLPKEYFKCHLKNMYNVQDFTTPFISSIQHPPPFPSFIAWHGHPHTIEQVSALHENCTIHGYYTVSSGNFLLIFWENISPIFRGQETFWILDS